MAKLFISFTGTMYALQYGRVNRDDLNTGLFVFGCTRDHAMAPGSRGEHVENIIVMRPDLHGLLVAALLQAEVNERVHWRTGDQRSSFAMIDDLLIKNEYKALAKDDSNSDYCYPAVQQRTALEVIW